MAVDDIAQVREQQAKSSSVVGVFHVAVDGVKEPESGIGRMVKAFILAFRKHVGDEPIANVMREGPQDVSGLGMATGREREPFEADHGVASPVGKPVISGDYRSNLITRSQ